MRKAIRCSIVATITFGFGMVLANCWGYFFPQRVTLCTLARNPAKYHLKLVRLEAEGSVISSPVYDDNSIIIFEPGCTEPNASASVYATKLTLSKDVDIFINSPQPAVRKAKIEVIGRFNQWATMGCFSPQFGIRANSITLTSAVESEPLPKMPRDNASSGEQP